MAKNTSKQTAAEKTISKDEEIVPVELTEQEPIEQPAKEEQTVESFSTASFTTNIATAETRAVFSEDAQAAERRRRRHLGYI